VITFYSPGIFLTLSNVVVKSVISHFSHHNTDKRVFSSFFGCPCPRQNSLYLFKILFILIICNFFFMRDAIIQMSVFPMAFYCFWLSQQSWPKIHFMQQSYLLNSYSEIFQTSLLIPNTFKYAYT